MLGGIGMLALSVHAPINKRFSPLENWPVVAGIGFPCGGRFVFATLAPPFDQKDGTYQNPVLWEDYSNLICIGVASDHCAISSTFHY